MRLEGGNSPFPTSESLNACCFVFQLPYNAVAHGHYFCLQHISILV